MKINSHNCEMFVTFVRNCCLRKFLTVSVIALFFFTLQYFSAEARTLKIVGLGDSLMVGYGLAPGEDLAAQLTNLLNRKGYDVEIINAGVSGDTSSGGLARLNWSVPDGTDGVVLELGANDALRAIAPSHTRVQLDKIITSLKTRKIPVLLVGMKAPPNLGAAYGQAFDELYPELAHKHDLIFYPFILKDVVAIPRLNQADGIHPTAEGVSIMANNLLPKMIEFLETIQSSK